jgi:hypothetical protein
VAGSSRVTVPSSFGTQSEPKSSARSSCPPATTTRRVTAFVAASMRVIAPSPKSPTQTDPFA